MYELTTSVACWWIGENAIAWLRFAADRLIDEEV